MRFLLLFLLCNACHELNAQFYKDNCVAGNCRNGFGLMRVSTTRDPLPHTVGTFNNTFYYYLAGEFKKGKLEGKGCRFEVPWNNGNFKPYDELYGSMIKQGLLPKPDSSRFQWFETGTYANDKLNGEGFLVQYNYGGYNSKAKLIRQGQFQNGKLEGRGVKIISRPGPLYDTITKNYGKNNVEFQTVIAGTYKNDACVSGTKTMMSSTGVWGNITGEYLDNDFLTGWVIKDYYDNAKNSNTSEGFHFVRTQPYRVIYVGGIETGNRFPAEQAADIRKADLGDGRIYEGEVDINGKPFGFGEIKSAAYYYKGFVDNGQPHGYGIYYASPVISKVMGGRFEYGRLASGTSYQSGGWPTTIQCVGYTKNPAPPEFNLFTGQVYNGDYFERTYNYDANTRTYKLSREKSGYMINGQPSETYVSVGKTNEDIKKQRTVTNGNIAFRDVVPGDVVVLDGLASLVVDNKYMRINLADGRYIVDNFQNQPIRLSRHKAEAFEHSCNTCNGKAFTTITYTPPPQEVVLTRYRPETIVGDFTIYTHYVTETTRYTKTFGPVTRKEFCSKCNGTGREKITTQLKE